MCGLCCLGCVTDESVPRKACYIDHIAVDERFRGKGVGKVLMQRADYEAKRNGCSKIYLAVAASNRAKNLYERQGFRVVSHDSSCIAWCATGISEFYQMEK